MKKFYFLLFILLCAGISTVRAQYISHDSTLTASGNYSGLQWAKNVTITIPAGVTVTVGNMGYGAGKLKVYGTLNATGNPQVDDSLVVGKGGTLTVSGTLTTDNDVVIDTSAQVTVGGYSPNTGEGDSINIRSNAVFKVNGSVTLNNGGLDIWAGASMTVTGDFNQNNPDNNYKGTLTVNGTYTIANGPNRMECPGKIITKNLTNNSGPDPFSGDGYIQVTGTFTGANSFTNSSAIVMNLPSGYSGNPGSATLGTTDPCTASSTLPVSIKYFNVSVDNGHVVLDWITGSEQNNSGFIVENSADGIHFNQVVFVGTKAVNGNSSSNLSYEFTDNNPLAGTSYYRIQQKNTDGSVSYTSGIAKVETGKTGSVMLYPNPVTSTLYISGNVTAGAAYRVININGQTVAKSSTTSIEVLTLPQGIYFVQEITGKQVETIGKFIKR